MSHSLKNFWDPLFLYRKIMFGLFFFSGHFWHDFCFFFFLGKVYLHSLTRLKNVFFFFPLPEKKNGFLTHSRDFCRKIQKNKLFPGKKKRYLWHEGTLFLYCDKMLKNSVDSRVLLIKNRKFRILNFCEKIMRAAVKTNKAWEVTADMS